MPDSDRPGPDDPVEPQVQALQLAQGEDPEFIPDDMRHQRARPLFVRLLVEQLR